MATRSGGSDRVSTKAKLAAELTVLGALLAETRERLGVRQAVVAQRLGLPASWLSKIESGTRRIDPVELVRIAEAMGADPGEIIRELQRRLDAQRPGESD